MLVIKVDLKIGTQRKEIRRFSFLDSLSFEDVKEQLREKLEIPEGTRFSLQYIDSEKDKVTIGSEEEFLEAKRQQSGSQMKLLLHINQNQVSGSVETAATLAEDTYDTVPEYSEVVAEKEAEKVAEKVEEVAAEKEAEKVEEVAPTQEKVEETAAAGAVCAAPIGFQDMGVAAGIVMQDIFQQMFPQFAQGMDAAAVQARLTEVARNVTVAATGFAEQLALEAEKARKLHEEQMEQIRQKVQQQQQAAAAAAAGTEQLQLHENVTCDGCGMAPLRGNRYKCAICPDYDLCECCENRCIHPPQHPFLKIKVPKKVVISLE